MKDYLSCPLTEEEKDLINGMIWRTAKTFKIRLATKKSLKTISIEDVELFEDDRYDFGSYDTIVFPRPLRPYSMKEKQVIVDYVDSLLSELSLNEFKIALTFEEKLVLFLYYFHKYIEDDVSILLGISKRTVTNRKSTIKEKKLEYLGGNNNV